MTSDIKDKKLPTGWERVRLGDISEIVYGYTARANPDAVGPKYLRITDIQDGAVDWSRVPSCEISPRDESKKGLRHGDIVVARTGSTGKSFLVSQPPRAVLASYLLRVRVNDSVLPEYLAYFFNSDRYWSHISDASRGSVQANVNARILGNMPIPIPPLAEQRRIVARLNAQMAVVERAKAAAREILDAADALNAAIVLEMMPYLGHHLEDFWKWAKLGEVCEINPRRPPKLAIEPDAKTTFVPMESVDGKSGAIVQPQERQFAQVSKGYTHFKNGDVLFAKITPCMQNGKHAIASGLLNGFGFGSTEFHIIRHSDAVTPEWIHNFIRQPSVLREAERHFRGAVGQQRVPKEFLINLEIPIPPLAEQRRIVALIDGRLAAARRLQSAARDGLDAIESMPSALLRRAMGDGDGG